MGGNGECKYSEGVIICSFERNWDRCHARRQGQDFRKSLLILVMYTFLITVICPQFLPLLFYACQSPQYCAAPEIVLEEYTVDCNNFIHQYWLTNVSGKMFTFTFPSSIPSKTYPR